MWHHTPDGVHLRTFFEASYGQINLHLTKDETIRGIPSSYNSSFLKSVSPQTSRQSPRREVSAPFTDTNSHVLFGKAEIKTQRRNDGAGRTADLSKQLGADCGLTGTLSGEIRGVCVCVCVCVCLCVCVCVCVCVLERQITRKTETAKQVVCWEK